MIGVFMAALMGGNLALTSLTGQKIQPIKADGRKATVVYFIAHDCPISNQYAPELNRICKAYEAKGVKFFIDYAEPNLSQQDAVKHAKAYRYTCPALLDPKGKLAKLAGAVVTPEAALFDRKGKRVYVGRIDDLFYDFGKRRTAVTTHDLRDAIDATLAGKAVSHPVTKATGCYISFG